MNLATKKMDSKLLMPSSSAASPSSYIYSLPKGFPPIEEFEECYGKPSDEMPPQYFLRIPIILCFGTSFIFSKDGRLKQGCRRNSYFFLVLRDTPSEQRCIGPKKSYPDDPHYLPMVFGYLKNGIINLDLARKKLNSDILNPFLVKLGLPSQK